MKKIFVSAVVLLAGIMASAQPAVTVESISKVNLPEGVVAANPTISPDGSFVVFTSDRQISKVDLATGDVSKVADAIAAYDVKISADGSQVVYTEPSFQNKLRYVSLKSADLNSGSVTTIVKPSRHLNAGVTLQGNTVNAVENGKMRAKALDGSKVAKAPIASINYGHLEITVDGKTTVIDPQGRGSYLWPSISPDGTKVVYFCAGRGCYVANIDGSNPQYLGVLRAAVWAGNDMVIGMYDLDNEETVISSVLFASDLNGNKVALTAEDGIAMYPTTSLDAKKVAFSDANGGIYIINLK